jgi:hypothetical protein
MMPLSQTPTKHSEENGPIMISVQTGLDGYRLRNFYYTNTFQGFVWMIFLLHSVALVGIFLGLANLIAFGIDIPLGILQRYIPTKRLFIIAAIFQLIATGIFFGFIFHIFFLLHTLTGSVGHTEVVDWFFGSALNWIGVIVASLCYGFAKEINDVSTYGYVLSHADPSEYATILARNNITFGIGSLVGLLLSGVILSSNQGIAVLFLGGIIIVFLFFTLRFFDNASDSISLEDIDQFRISIQRWNKEHVKEYITETIKKADIGKIVQ